MTTTTIERILESNFKTIDLLTNDNKFDKDSILQYCKEIENICKNEMAIAEAKSKGGNEELKRKRAAEWTFKEAKKHLPEDRFKTLNGYCPTEKGNKIIITNGFYAYIGNSIVGINKIDNSEIYPFKIDVFSKFENRINNGTIHSEVLNLSKIKTISKIAKAEFKSINKKTDNQFVNIGNSWFNPEYLIKCCELLGGNDFKIQVNKDDKLSVARIAGKNGVCYLMPVNRQGRIEE